MSDTGPRHGTTAALPGLVLAAAGLAVLYGSLQGPGGGLFLAPLASYPLTVGGGVLVGHAVTDRPTTDRPVRIATGMAGGTTGFLALRLVDAAMSTAPFVSTSVDLAPYALGLAGLAVIVAEMVRGG